MLILLGLTVLLIGAIALAQYRAEHGPDILGILTVSVVGVTGIALVLALGFWPAVYLEQVGEIQQYQATVQSVERARSANVSDVERAALQHKIVEANRWLAAMQYWNGTLFDIWIPDGVDTLEPLK